MECVTTVLGDIAPEQLGFCQPHEHVYINGTVALETHPELRLTSVGQALAELRLVKASGCDAVVDAQPGGAGRDPLVLREVSRLSGVTIVASTGYHVPFFYPEDHWLFTTGEDALAEHFNSEIQTGMFGGGGYAFPDVRTDVRAGVIKAALGPRGLAGRDETLFRAAVQAAAATGAAILLHTDKGAGALDAVRVMADAGLAPDRLLVCHVDRQATDYGIHEAIAETGAFLEYDTITLFQHHNNAEEVLLIDHMIKQGHLDRLLLSTDPTADRLKSHGAPVGMDYIRTAFLPLLRAFGLTESMLDRLCRVNPARALKRIV
ncbi:MAG: TatD family hydrolase [Planctomycetes bacterium]|nr:TatD family hydrolase [Planctomycetota bacterium]